MGIVYILLLVVIIIGGFVGLTYNSLVKLKNKSEEGWADIDTQLKRRYDLIPNIVETVKGYAAHESGTLTKITEARSAAMNAQGTQAKGDAENMLSSALKSIFALAENYPDLKANQNFSQLQATLAEIEEHVQLSRRYYNGTVRDLNTKIQTFPANIFAGMLGFANRDFFQADDSEKENVQVKFSEGGEQAPAAPAAEAPAEPAAETPAETPAPETPAETPEAPAPAAPAAEEMTVTPAEPEEKPEEAAPAETPEAPAEEEKPPQV